MNTVFDKRDNIKDLMCGAFSGVMKNLQINYFIFSYSLHLLIQILYAHPRKYLCFGSITETYLT